MAVSTSSVWTGWRLVGLASITLVIMAAAVAAMAPNAVEGARAVIRMTARTSLLLFLMAFVASSLARMFPSALTRWLRANRRYIGVSFAVSHLLHAIAIITLARLDPALFAQLTNVGSFIGGGIAYLFIILMTATSFDRTAALIGPRAWRLLHTAGIWFLWVSFTLNFGKRIPTSPYYWLPVALLLAALVLRIVARRRANRPLPV